MRTLPAPVTYVQLATTVAATEQSYQQALSGTNRRHVFIPLPVYGITPRHSLILFIGGPVNIPLMMIGNEDSAFFRSTRGALPFLQPAVDQQCRDRTAAPHIRTRIEWVDQNVADQALGGDLPSQLCPTDRIRRQLDV